MALSRWDPFFSFPSAFPVADRRFFNRARRLAALQDTTTGALPLDVYETQDALVVKAHLPGLEPKDVTVHVERGVLSISAEVGSESEEADKERRYHVREVWQGTLNRSITLPVTVDADKAVATFKSGVLTLTIPKAEAAKPRQIPVSAEN